MYKLPMKAAGILLNTATKRYHPIVFRHAPPPSGDLTSFARYKSIGHHTEGFDTEEQAVDFIVTEGMLWTENVWSWDGVETPAMVIWGPLPCEATRVVEPVTAFISGHLDLTDEEFNEHYEPRILNGMRLGWAFIVGDARGADAFAQQLLRDYGKVTVYHMFDSPRNNAGHRTKGGFKSDRERDEAMTAASTTDIAWVRPGREKSGTAKNLARRASQLSMKDRPVPDEETA